MSKKGEEYSPLWSYAHMLAKSLQTSALLGFVGGLGYHAFKAKAFNAAVLASASAVTGTVVLYGFPALSVISIGVLLYANELPVPRAERFAKNWRQLTVDGFTVAGALLYPALMRSPNLINDISVGAAIGTLAYIALLPVWPHYDSKDWTATDPRNVAAKKGTEKK